MHTPSDVVADQIRKHRERLGLSREALAQECEKLGAPQLTTAAIINIETGRPNPTTGRRRREVSVDELLVFAYALGVPPLLLVFPVGRVADVPAPPHWQGMNPMLAWRWAMGDEAPSRMKPDGLPYADRSRIGEGGPTRYEAWRQVVHPLTLHRRLTEEVAAMNKAARMLNYREKVGEGNSEEAGHLARVRQHHLMQVAGTLEEMMNAGFSVPSYMPDIADEIKATGVLSHPEALPVISAQQATDA